MRSMGKKGVELWGHRAKVKLELELEQCSLTVDVTDLASVARQEHDGHIAFSNLTVALMPALDRAAWALDDAKYEGWK